MKSVITVPVALVIALACAGCGKFQQARECGAFVKTVNAWLAEPESAAASNGLVPGDPQQIAEQSRHTADHYDELSQRLAALHIRAEELVPRVARYQALAGAAARTLREVAAALDRGDLVEARKKRVEFDDASRAEPDIVRELNGICR